MLGSFMLSVLKLYDVVAYQWESISLFLFEKQVHDRAT